MPSFQLCTLCCSLHDCALCREKRYIILISLYLPPGPTCLIYTRLLRMTEQMKVDLSEWLMGEEEMKEKQEGWMGKEGGGSEGRLYDHLLRISVLWDGLKSLIKGTRIWTWTSLLLVLHYYLSPFLASLMPLEHQWPAGFLFSAISLDPLFLFYCSSPFKLKLFSEFISCFVSSLVNITCLFPWSETCYHAIHIANSAPTACGSLSWPQMLRLVTLITFLVCTFYFLSKHFTEL